LLRIFAVRTRESPRLGVAFEEVKTNVGVILATVKFAVAEVSV
jgi:hypothetical protein